MSERPLRDECGRREWCDKHRCWYVPFQGPMDPDGVPCHGCLIEAEAHDRACEDHNIRASLGVLDG